MPSLRATQEEFKNLLFYRASEAQASFLWKEGIPARLRVYRHNTRSNWSDTLDHDFSLTRKQFSDREWQDLRHRYFVKHPPMHWELNASVASFPRFLKTQKVKAYIKELADFEWNDLCVFIHRAQVQRGLGVTNPTIIIRAYHHQLFFWVQSEAAPERPPEQKPEVLLFYRDSKNTTHIQEADPLLILLLEHFKTAHAILHDLEPLRATLLPTNNVRLALVYDRLVNADLILR